MSTKNAGWPITQTLSSCDSSRGRARSDSRSDEVHESSFPYLTPLCWHASKDDIAKYCTVRLSHWDEHVELLAGVTRHLCFQLAHDSCCTASRCEIWFEWVCFQVLYTSTLRYAETSFCLIPCLRPELVGAECCDIHAFLCLPQLLACVTQQYCFQLIHGACCAALTYLAYLASFSDLSSAVIV